jgi:hypothetical protein
MTMKVRPNVSFDFAMHMETIEEIGKADVAAIVDTWLDQFTSSDALTRAAIRGRMFYTDDLDLTACHYDAVLATDAWVYWNDRLDGMCIQWLSNMPCSRSLKGDVAAELESAISELTCSGITADHGLIREAWRRLSFDARYEIGLRVSCEALTGDGRDRVRDELIHLLAETVQKDSVHADACVRTLAWSEIVLIDRSTRQVCARGADLAEAARDLRTCLGYPIDLVPAPGASAADCVYLAYRVPDCIDFAPEDAALVERWGTYEASFVTQVPQAVRPPEGHVRASAWPRHPGPQKLDPSSHGDGEAVQGRQSAQSRCPVRSRKGQILRIRMAGNPK